MSWLVTRMRLLMALLVLGAGGASYVAAQGSAGGDRTETVDGWRLEDVADTSDDDDRVARIIRMTREAAGGELSYEVRISGYGGTGWASTSYSSALGHANRSCSKSGPAAVETGAPAQRPARVRAMLERRLGEIERECGAPAGTMATLLDGFEAAFARLASWHGVRFAEVEAAIAAGQATATDDGMDMAIDMNLDGGDDMAMDMNMMDMNATAMDAYGNHSEMEAAADEMRAAEAAMRAAEAAFNETAEPR